MTLDEVSRAVPAGARVVVAGLVSARGDEDKPVLETVLRTVDNWGATVVATVLQRRGIPREPNPDSTTKARDPIHSATFFGSGKVRELVSAVQDGRADCVVVCNALTTRHCQNLEDAVGVPVYGIPPAGETAP